MCYQDHHYLPNLEKGLLPTLERSRKAPKLGSPKSFAPEEAGSLSLLLSALLPGSVFREQCIYGLVTYYSVLRCNQAEDDPPITAAPISIPTVSIAATVLCRISAAVLRPGQL